MKNSIATDKMGSQTARGGFESGASSLRNSMTGPVDQSGAQGGIAARPSEI